MSAGYYGIPNKYPVLRAPAKPKAPAITSYNVPYATPNQKASAQAQANSMISRINTTRSTTNQLPYYGVPQPQATKGRTTPTNTAGSSGGGGAGGTTGGGTTGGGTTGGGTTGGNTTGDGSAGGGLSDMEGQQYSMNGTTYSAIDLQNMLADPQFFTQEWARAYGNTNPGFVAQFGNMAKALPYLYLLSQGTKPSMQIDANGNPIDDPMSAPRTAAEFERILAAASTPGASVFDANQYIRDILTTAAVDPDQKGIPTFLQSALMLNEDGSEQTYADQAASTNQLLQMASIFGAPGMRGLLGAALAWMGNNYRMSTLNANSENPQPYNQWLRDNASSYGVV